MRFFSLTTLHSSCYLQQKADTPLAFHLRLFLEDRLWRLPPARKHCHNSLRLVVSFCFIYLAVFIRDAGSDIVHDVNTITKWSGHRLSENTSAVFAMENEASRAKGSELQSGSCRAKWAMQNLTVMKSTILLPLKSSVLPQANTFAIICSSSTRRASSSKRGLRPLLRYIYAKRTRFLKLLVKDK